jgi:hypothetical protein
MAHESRRWFCSAFIKKAALCLFGAILIAGCASSASAQINNGEQLITAMHARYAQSWYRTVTFQEQAITRNDNGTVKKEIWYESLLLPGKLRINKGSPNSGNGAIFTNNTLTSFVDGKSTGTRPFVHMLLVLGFDVYRQDPELTIAEAKNQGFDLNQIHQDVWQGRVVYVVGAKKGDLKSRQFWIEKNQLLFVRLIEPDPRDATKLDDQRFSDYRRLRTGWIAAYVEFLSNGQNVFNERYFNIQENVKLDPSIFDPQKFNSR